MMKAKQKHFTAMISEDNSSLNSVENSSEVDLNLTEEDSWVVVKKQKVNVLIPRLACTEMCSMPNLDVTQEEPCLEMPNTSINAPPEALVISLAETNDFSVPLSPKLNSQTVPVNAPAIPEPGKPEQRRQNIEGQVGAFCKKKRSHMKFHGLSQNPFRAFEKQGQCGVNKLSRCTLGISKVTRASILERKITKAGGLGKWLSSLGLKRFERILCGKNLHKYQLANLSMKMLKDMGAHAVGPRRKLVHAIEGLCQQNS